MKNEYIEVVKRWIAGEEVSIEALKANSDAARVAYDAAARDATHAHAAARTARAAANAYDADNTAHWVKWYEELTNEK